MKQPLQSSSPQFTTALGDRARRGVATVEFALMAPLFVTLTMGVIQAGIQFSTAQTLTSALREGGRIASMNYTSKLLPGQTINQKVVTDIQNFLTAEGIKGNQVTVTITAADGAGSGSTFNLADPNNQLALFKIHAVIPYSAVSSVTFFPHTNTNISASVVYRLVQNGLVQ